MLKIPEICYVNMSVVSYELAWTGPFCPKALRFTQCIATKYSFNNTDDLTLYSWPHLYLRNVFVNKRQIPFIWDLEAVQTNRLTKREVLKQQPVNFSLKMRLNSYTLPPWNVFPWIFFHSLNTVSLVHISQLWIKLCHIQISVLSKSSWKNMTSIFDHILQ